MTLEEIATAIVWLGGLAVAGGAIWRWILVPIARAARAIGKYAEVHDVIMEIASEFKPNHGSSLRDVVHEIRDEMKAATEERAAMRIQVNNIQQQFEQHLIDDQPWDNITERRTGGERREPSGEATS